jgi:N-acetyl-anhydromuramyl-L-alanine amidase AmpD
VSRDLRLPADQYFAESGGKSGIALHHTVGGNAASSVRWWREDGQMVGTAYLIDRDGTIHEAFEPTSWAWQFGLKWPDAKRIRFERRFIGIEICSEGGLIEEGGRLYAFDRVTPRTEKARAEAFDFGRPYRGYRYFDRYEEAQLAALTRLVNELCARFPIPRRVPRDFLGFQGEALAEFEGVIGHAMVREDKSDPLPDVAFWERLVRECGLEVVDPTARGGAGRGLSAAEVDALFEQNVQQIHVLNVAAGSMVKGLIMELERNGRNTYVRLRDPVPSGHAVGYELVQGDRTLVGRLGRALGFAAVTDDRLEVRHG